MTQPESQLVVLALTDAERNLVVQAVRELVEREGPSSTAGAVLEMAAGALEPDELARLVGARPEATS